ncbi:Retinol dehydrogenase 5 [Borealophlyctis nickersoniae]|nr:Retinol dehydrogenase 5 [Borealophlyctis nickersoniae]
MGSSSSALAPQGPVLITGCDSGFGHDLCLRLSRKGWTVYAACLTENGVVALKATGVSTLRPVQMDITKAGDIERVRSLIEKEHPEGLYALVNNAGIAVGDLIEWLSMDDFRRVMEVNYFGHVATTKAFIPALRKFGRKVVLSKGKAAHPRVTFVTSAAGKWASARLSAYAASKHAMEGFASSLRYEMLPFNIQVHVIGPIFARTPLAVQASGSFEKRLTTVPEEVKRQYGVDNMREMVKRYETEVIKEGGLMTVSIDEVVRTMEETVVKKVPKNRYAVGFGAKWMVPLLLNLPFWLAVIIGGGSRYTTLVREQQKKLYFSS